MVPKLHAPPEVQLLVNKMMSWAEEQLKAQGWISAAAAWLPRNTSEPGFRTLKGSAAELSVAQQESLLSSELEGPWLRNELAAILLAAPVIYGRMGSAERTEAVRLHVEAASGYCADILMPYRIRPAGRWRKGPRNRVHFSHPLAQESDSFAPVQGYKTNAHET
jgi:hypothetical protein